jgi:hypothetical protein
VILSTRERGRGYGIAELQSLTERPRARYDSRRNSSFRGIFKRSWKTSEAAKIPDRQGLLLETEKRSPLNALSAFQLARIAKCTQRAVGEKFLWLPVSLWPIRK